MRQFTLLSVVLFLCSMTLAQTGVSAYQSDLEAFFAEMDRSYPFFELKGIEAHWNETKARLLDEVKTCDSDESFLAILAEGVRALNDGHMGIVESRVPVPQGDPEFYPGISFMPGAGDKVLVMSVREELANALPRGTVVTAIDGEPARELLDKQAKDNWPSSGQSSPQRVRLFTYRIPLRSGKGDRHILTFQTPDGEMSRPVVCDLEARGWPHTYNMPAGLKQAGKSFWYTQLDSGAGYMYLRRIDDSIVPGMQEALRTYPEAKGWIMDLRGNGGGGYDDTLIFQLRNMPRPVAGIIDAGCVSAGETIARDIVRYSGAKLFGTKTAGSSSSKRTWSLPSGIATIRMSTRSRGGIDGRPIEFNGIDPHVWIEPLPEDVQAGRNSAIRFAEEYVVASE